MKNQNLNNYHWTEGDISKFTQTFLTQQLEKSNYTIKKIDCEAYVSQRMGKIGLIYYITLKAEKDGRCIDLEEHDQYADFSCLATEDADAFTEIFKEYEQEAKKQNASFILDENVTVEKKNLQKLVEDFDNKNVTNNEKLMGKLSSYSLLYKINCKKEDLIGFFTNMKMINVWGCGEFLKNENGFSINRLEFKDMQVNDDILFKWKLKDWNHFYALRIKFCDISGGTRVEVIFKDIENDKCDQLQNLWHDLVFYRICMCFGFKMMNDD
ncbi:hypothetical protein COBT_002749 [Conglomerata obtusa]